MNEFTKPMIERAAHAIFATQWPGADENKLPKDWVKENYTKLAEAALTAALGLDSE